jgi:hypothetical protein
MTNRNPERAGQPDNVYFERLVASTEQATRAVAPIMKGAACAHLELTSLAGRRARAYLDIPSTLAQDVLAAQARFWQQAYQDYSAYTQRVVSAFGALDADRPLAGDGRASAARERDTLTFPDVFSFANWALPEKPPRRREEEGRAA